MNNYLTVPHKFNNWEHKQYTYDLMYPRNNHQGKQYRRLYEMAKGRNHVYHYFRIMYKFSLWHLNILRIQADMYFRNQLQMYHQNITHNYY